MKPILIANWKQYLSVQESLVLAKQLKRPLLRAQRKVDVVICPSMLAWMGVREVFRGRVALGAQDVFWSDDGPHTSAIGPTQLKSVGCNTVLVGHSERRTDVRETSEDVARKALAALAAGLRVVVCVGEAGGEELAASLEGVESILDGQLLVAYEPDSAISGHGGGGPAPVDQVSEMAQHLQEWLKGRFSGQDVPVLYGGSVDATQVRDYVACPGISGVLVGRMSTRAKDSIDLLEVLSNDSA